MNKSTPAPMDARNYKKYENESGVNEVREEEVMNQINLVKAHHCMCNDFSYLEVATTVKNNQISTQVNPILVVDTTLVNLNTSVQDISSQSLARKNGV